MRLREINGLRIYSNEQSVGIVSFALEGIHSHDIASLVNDDGVAIRAGHHCAMPLMRVLGVQGTCRVSFHIYNTKEDIDALINSLKKVLEVFKK